MSEGTVESGHRSACWCCSGEFVEAELVGLGAHPEAGVCFGCARSLHRRARTAQERDLRSPGAVARRGVGRARGFVVAHGAQDWPVLGTLLRRVDRHLP